jgi:uncharacterized protein with HEPN domain
MNRDRVHLLDILEAARPAVIYVKGISREAFLRNTQLQDSVIRRIEIIGEAARRVSEETRKVFSDIPWTEMTGMRNLMIHDYNDVDLEVVWETVQLDLPSLIALIEPLVPPEQE